MVVASVTPCLVFDKKPNAKQVKELHMGPSGNTVHDVGNPMSLEKFTKEFTKKYLQEWYESTEKDAQKQLKKLPKWAKFVSHLDVGSRSDFDDDLDEWSKKHKIKVKALRIG